MNLQSLKNNYIFGSGSDHTCKYSGYDTNASKPTE